jgi:cystathionine beta-lyase
MLAGYVLPSRVPAVRSGQLVGGRADAHGGAHMTFDFDRVIDRSGTNAVAKLGFHDYLFDGDPPPFACAEDDLISMWVADMAFAAPPAAIEAMEERLTHPIFGYSANFDDRYVEAFRGWCTRRYDWAPPAEQFLTSPGVVPALFDLVDCFVQPAEKVLTLTPSYGFFKAAPDHHERELVTCALVPDGAGGHSIDFDDLESKLADPATSMFFLCHPHNPTGRAFTEDELRRMASLAFEHDVLIVSDEIHCDLLRMGRAHVPLAKLFPDSTRIITCMSSSKTFNLAGLGLSHLLIPDADDRERWKDRTSPVLNPISLAGVVGVLEHGDPWWMALRGQLDANFKLVADAIASGLPEARFAIPDTTYLAWVDLSEYFAAEENLTRWFGQHGGVLLEGGDMFVADADGHIRLNVACPPSILTEGLERVIAAVPRAS